MHSSGHLAVAVVPATAVLLMRTWSGGTGGMGSSGVLRGEGHKPRNADSSPLDFMARPTLFFSFAAANLYQVPLGSSESPTDDDLKPRWDDASCTISRGTAYDVLEGPSNFSWSPSDPINSIKIDPLVNKTNWEQWEFDGISHTGFPLMMVMFSRGYSCYFFSKGNLRMEMFMTTADGNLKASAILV
ncbi:hypothetical protein FQN55_007527 [Onygenales sp. PD_40]|nr:hypothetical protein FQN55_007527 [Onygenales sp. PD_40]